MWSGSRVTCLTHVVHSLCLKTSIHSVVMYRTIGKIAWYRSQRIGGLGRFPRYEKSSLQNSNRKLMVHDDQIIYGGISVDFFLKSESHIAIALRDDTYLLDFIEKTLSAPYTHSNNISRNIISELRD